MSRNYPKWVCYECGFIAANTGPLTTSPTWHIGLCEICGKKRAVTEPRDFGYPEFKAKQKIDGITRRRK